jgi:hypothetical protein
LVRSRRIGADSRVGAASSRASGAGGEGALAGGVPGEGALTGLTAGMLVSVPVALRCDEEGSRAVLGGISSAATTAW